MKVHQKLFVVALLLSLILSVGTVMAQDDMTFEQSNLGKNSIETSNNLGVNQDSNGDKLSAMMPDNDDDGDVDKLSQGGGGKSAFRK